MRSRPANAITHVSSLCLAAIGLLAFAAPCLAAQSPQPTAPLSPLEQKMAAVIDAHVAEDTQLLEQIVNINSGTMHLAGVEAVKDVLQPRFEALGFKVRWVPMQSTTGRAGDLVAEHPCLQGAVLAASACFSSGTWTPSSSPTAPSRSIPSYPRTDGKVATGPGIADMKGGLVIMLAALRAMKETGALDHAAIRIVLSGDEERFGDPGRTRAPRHDRRGEAKRCGS